MKYLSIVSNRRDVESSDGKIIVCNYFKHPRFNTDCLLCAGLHYTFIRYVPDRTYSKAYSLRTSIKFFLDFIVLYEERNPNQVWVKDLLDVDAEIFNSYILFLNKIQAPKESALRLKVALQAVAKSYDEGMPLLTIPNIGKIKHKSALPLDYECYLQLEEALKSHIDGLYEKLEYRKKVNDAKPYDDETILREANPLNRRNIFRKTQYYLEKAKGGGRKKLLASFRSFPQKVKACVDDKELVQIGTTYRDARFVDKFLEYYFKEAKPYLLKHPEDPIPGKTMASMYKWIPDPVRSLKTLILNGHPFDVSFEEYYQVNRRACQSTKISGDAIELIYKRFNNNQLRYYEREENIQGVPSFDDLLNMYFPTMIDQAAIALFLMLQTGWNKETVMAIDSQNFENPIAGAFNADKIMIFSEKRKSQSNNKPYLTPKPISALSDKKKDYSAYKLICLARDLSNPFTELPIESTSRMLKEYNPLFLYVRPYSGWSNKGNNDKYPGRFSCITDMTIWKQAVIGFLKKYEVFEKGKRIKSAKSLTSRLRPTWLQHIKNKIPRSLASLLMGHLREETTDVFYDSSGPAMQERYDRLRLELESIMNLLKTRQFKGLLSSKDKSAINHKALRLFVIPGQTNVLWGCQNSFKPDWIGNEAIISKGVKCSEIPQCMFCSQVCIFEDSLPFLIERYSVVQKQIETSLGIEFNSPLVEELKIIEYILDNWGDEVAVKNAVRYHRRYAVKLPQDMGLLSLIFED